jgi:hypothetical protein
MDRTTGPHALKGVEGGRSRAVLNVAASAVLLPLPVLVAVLGLQLAECVERHG